MARIVTALGGNALGNDPVTQQKHVDLAADIISSMVLMEHERLVAHANGPQVGMINLAFEKGKDIQKCSLASTSVTIKKKLIGPK